MICSPPYHVCQPMGYSIQCLMLHVSRNDTKPIYFFFKNYHYLYLIVSCIQELQTMIISKKLSLLNTVLIRFEFKIIFNIFNMMCHDICVLQHGLNIQFYLIYSY